MENFLAPPAQGGVVLLYQGRILGVAKVHRVVHVVLQIHRKRFVDYSFRLQTVRVRMLVGVAVVQVVVACRLLSLAAEPVSICGGRFRFAAKERYQLSVLGGEVTIALVHLAVACGQLEKRRKKHVDMWFWMGDTAGRLRLNWWLLV